MAGRDRRHIGLVPLLLLSPASCLQIDIRSGSRRQHDLTGYVLDPSSDDWDEFYDSGALFNTSFNRGPLIPCRPLKHTAQQLRELQRNVQEGPVAVDNKAELTQPVHVFLMVPPFWGSTALLSLLSSSPSVTTLCAAGTWQCEGTWLLKKFGAIDKEEAGTLAQWNQHYPSWGEALRTFDQFWDKAKPIKVEKSPPNIAKVRQIAEHFKDKKDQVAFIFMTRSACFGARRSEYWGAYAELLLHGLATVQTDYKVKTIKYEDMLLDPYAVARDLLEFLPSLLSLNPNIVNLPKSHGEHGGDRSQSLADYILRRGPFVNKFTDVSQMSANLSRRLGYFD